MRASKSFLLLLASCRLQLLLSQGTDLGGGVVTTTDVKSFADLSQDISSMQTLVSQGQPEEALGIYRDGQHSEEKLGFKRSFKSMADQMSAAEPKTPSFLFHLYGQADRELSLAFDQQKLNYINIQVQETFQTRPSVGVEALWILNVWQYAVHILYYGVYECEQRSLAENPGIFDIGMAGWDEFIALYIGSGQSPGATNGDSLYKWAQLYAETMKTSDGEAVVNTRVKLLYQEAINVLNVEGACTKNNPGTAGELWKLVVQMVSELSKPLFQGFVYALNQKNADSVNIYAKALVPQLAKCRPSLYKRMHESLILNTFSVDTTTIEGILNDVPEATQCFGYPCGALGDTQIVACESAGDLNFAGFVPETPVGEVGKADLDVYQIKILTQLKSNRFAYYLYMHGANIAKFRQGNDPIEYVSLHDIGVSSERSSAQPWFDYFVSYNGEKDYADKAIQSILSGNSKWKATQQISAIVGFTASYQILLLEAVTKVKIAVEECRAADPDVDDSLVFVLNPIDEAAALLIGSMEGSQLGGSSDLEDGQLIYNINNKHAFQFGTLSPGQYSKAVSNIEDLLFAAKGQLDALDCDNLQHTTEEILRYSMIGIVQASIFLAVQNAELGDFSTAAGLAEAEALGLAMIPLVKQNDTSTAETLKTNTVRLLGSKPVPNGAEEVARLWGKGFTYTMQMACSNLGSIAVVNPCDGEWGNVVFNRSPPQGSNSGASTPGLLFASLSIGAAVLVLLAL